MSGTIRPRGPGRWQLQVYAAGRRYARTIHGTRRDATRALPEFVLEVRRRADQPLSDGATVATLLGRWLDVRATTWRPSTTLGNRAKIDRHVIPHIGDLPLGRLRAHHLDALYSELGTSLSSSTVAQIHRLLNAALNQAVRWDLIAVNPAQRATPPRPGRVTYTIPTPAQIAKMTDLVARDVPFAAFVRLGATTGARRGSLVALRWSDVDLDEGAVTFARSVSIGPDGPVELDGSKTGQVTRVAIAPGTVANLRSLRAWQAANALACGVPLGADAYLFSTDPAGRTGWHPDRATGRWRRARTRAGLEGVRLHDLRHAVATQLLAAGVDAVTVAGRLGHASPSVTLAVYAHALPERDRAAAVLLDDLLDGTG